MYLCSDTKRYLLVELQKTIHTLGDLRLLRNRKLRWTDSAKDNVAEKRSSLYLSDRKEEKTHLTHRVDKKLFFFTTQQSANDNRDTQSVGSNPCEINAFDRPLSSEMKTRTLCYVIIIITLQYAKYDRPNALIVNFIFLSCYL